MGFEFDESEMYPCDICGEFWPMGEMHELEDGRIVYRNGKKVLILAGKAAPKVLIEDRLADLIGAHTKQGISLDDVIPQNVVCITVSHNVHKFTLDVTYVQKGVQLVTKVCYYLEFSYIYKQLIINKKAFCLIAEGCTSGVHIIN